MPTATRTRKSTVDDVCAKAVDLARAAAVEDAGAAAVGEHLGYSADGERLVTHSFAAQDRAYRGWRWSVTLTRASRAKQPTVCEVVLLPGDEALLAPTWLPWHERLRPGDLGVGDLLPTPADDARLVPTFFAADDDEVVELGFELGLGRSRVLSADGRAETAQRWYDGDSGPEAAIAKAAPANCATCGFFIPLSGPLRQAFGGCANEFAPDDGRLVSVDHGCGAHSEAVVVPAAGPEPRPLVDEFGFDVVTAEVVTQTTGSIASGDEPFGHS